MTERQEPTEVLRAPLVIEYPFSRTTGPVIGAFLTGLRERQLIGIRGSDGRVLVPPVEYDPLTSEDLSELVEVGPGGTVTTWAWVNEPHEKHPFDHSFAWVMVQPDGADTAMLHALDGATRDTVRTGMRVVPRWRDERVGEIRDLECFVPEEQQ